MGKRGRGTRMLGSEFKEVTWGAGGVWEVGEVGAVGEAPEVAHLAAPLPGPADTSSCSFPPPFSGTAFHPSSPGSGSSAS